MTRPRRLYIDSTSKKPYYIINKRKVYVKVPKGISMKQLQKVNIKNIIQLPSKKRVKRKKKYVKPLLSDKITSGMLKGPEIYSTYGQLPTYFYEEKRIQPSLSEAGRKLKDDVFIPSAVKLPMASLIEQEDIPLATPLSSIPRSESKEDDFEDTIRDLSDLLSQLSVTQRTTTEPSIEPSQSIAERIVSRRPNQTIAERVVSRRRGLGVNGDDDGLYNDEIEKITKKRLKHFVPVIPSDKTEDLMKYVGRGNKEFAFVINTNPSHSDGSGTDGYKSGHWTCVYIDNRDDYPSCEFYDPLAEGLPPTPIIKIMRKIAKKMNPEKMFKYKQNLIRRQSYRTNRCGHHCIKFIEDRMNGIPFCEASGYDDFIEKHKGSDGSDDGEKDLEKVLPKYNSYI
jgi:hypothetical protein